MILRSPIFRKLFWSACLLIASTLVVLDFYLSRYMAQRQIENVERRLSVEARLLAFELNPITRAELESWALRAGARAGTRVTLIDPQGVVLADSEHDPDTMENHSNRPEIREALRTGEGASIRHSATLGRDLCYLARRTDYGGMNGHVLRLAVPLEDVEAAVAAVRWRILGASLGAALVTLIIAYFFSRSFTRRIARLRSFAESMVDPAASGVLRADAEDELGELARSLDRASRQLRDFVDRLSLESLRREAILASMIEGVLAVDHELRVIFCNLSFARAVGVRFPPPERVPVAELVRDPDLLELLSKALTSTEPQKRRLELSSGNERTFEVQVSAFAGSSQRGAIAILHDVSEIERLERVRKDFVANVSHELRTPLTAIRGYAETLLDGAIDDAENNRRFLEVIKAHAIRLNSIASDLLTLSELESGKLVPKLERTSVRTALDAALRTIEPEAEERGVTLHFKNSEDVYVTGDKVRLEQALINLLANAVKFNRRGGEVHVDARCFENGQVRIGISDTGIGIPSDDLPRIFERFYRVDKARSRDLGGTGLGLSIVRHVVERMQGSVTVESQLGRGSTFTVTLPAA